MKKNILLVGLLCIAMMNVSCGKTVHRDNQKTDISTTADADLDALNQKEITQKLSELRAEMPIDEVTELWGQKPEVVNESGSNIYRFYCGDTTITLWGDKIFQASVENGGFCYYVDLEPELIVGPELE